MSYIYGEPAVVVHYDIVHRWRCDLLVTHRSIIIVIYDVVIVIVCDVTLLLSMTYQFKSCSGKLTAWIYG